MSDRVRLGGFLGLLGVLAALVPTWLLAGGGRLDTAAGAALVAAAVLAVTAVAVAAARPAATRQVGRARVGVSREHVDAPGAYWCAVQVPHCPQRPRAPGRA